MVRSKEFVDEEVFQIDLISADTADASDSVAERPLYSLQVMEPVKWLQGDIGIPNVLCPARKYLSAFSKPGLLKQSRLFFSK